MEDQVRRVNSISANRNIDNRKNGNAPSKKRRGKLKFILISIAAVIILAAATFGVFFYLEYPGPNIDSSKYQAVFLTNGQVYFGKLNARSKDYMVLTDIWYLQKESTSTADGMQETSSDTSGVVMVKLGNEVHGPEDKMTIPKDQVLFYENLKTDGQVTASIKSSSEAK